MYNNPEVLGSDAGVLTPHTYSKLFCTELQNGLQWDSSKLAWDTIEFPINTKIAINPKLKKFEITNYIRQIPRMFQKFALGSDDDIIFISDTTVQPARVLTEYTKMNAMKDQGHKNELHDRLSSPFQIFKVRDCRRIMLKYADDDCNQEEKDRIASDRIEHMKVCTPCFVTFSHVAFAGGQDYVFVVVMLHSIEEALANANWNQGNGLGFSTPDIIGVRGTHAVDRMCPGPCIYFKTGSYKIQGRVASKAYAGLHVVSKVGSPKDTMDNVAVNINNIDRFKLQFFSKTIIGYLLKEHFRNKIVGSYRISLHSKF